jgi:poly-gamma-glutamate capsule biosynthesis protein CapA/YwtB (metallophosphatase superfamily)
LAKLTLVFCGDIMLGAEVASNMGPATVSDWLKGVSDVWNDSDLLIGNLEGPCVEDAEPINNKLPELILYSSTSRLRELATAGFSALTLGNNHILDCGPLGLAETIRGLDQAGICHAGAGMNLADALKPAIIRVRDVTVGLVSFCYGPPAGRSSPGAAPYHYKSMRRALREARASADFVIAALHDGLEYSDVPPSQTRKRLRFLAENGADIVVGHHPHVLQGVEWRNGVPIAYSLGDFLFDNSLSDVANANFSRMAMGLYAPDEIKRDPGKFGRGALLTVRISDGKKSVEWHPFRQDPNLRPQLSSGKTKLEDLQRLEDLSAALLNENDPRHILADSVAQAAWWKERDSLDMENLFKLALKPKWRYVPAGLKWVYRRLRLA